MPLEKSPSKAAFKTNIKREVDAGKPLKQALAISYDVQRRSRARGGSVDDGHPGGLLASHVPGRTDHLPLKVKPGSYVVPADVVSGMGEGNTMAGKRVIAKMYGMNMEDMPYTPAHRARGGAVPIMAAGGEFIIPPDKIKKKHGSLDSGHAILDKFIVGQRAKNIKTLKKLPGPARGDEKS